jgi:hypothetical protein
MKNCKKCNKEFEPQKGLINFCSLSCRNSKEQTPEIRKKKSEAALNSDKVKAANKGRSQEHWNRIAEKRNAIYRQKILTLPYSDLKFEQLRKRIFIEQEGKCNCCGISEWMGKSLTLELEHKDGNHYNNERSNLEMICPNCHSQTDTWRGRNKTKKRKAVSDEVLLESLLDNNWNMRQALIQVELAAKGGNYKRCHQLKRDFEEVNK